MKEKVEILLSKEEINEVEEYASRNPQLKDPMLMNIFGPGHKTVWKISPIHGLIFVKGNEHTGFEHIHQRHGFLSDSLSWIDIVDKSGSKRKIIQDQSKFRIDTIPFFDYTNIADSVYSLDNLDINNNNRPEDFDLFVGLHTNKNGTIEKYKLLTYKNTKVVHTLYPQSSKNNRKRIKKFDFARGSVSMETFFAQSTTEITVPYHNHAGNIKYSILIRKFLEKNIEKCFILIYNEVGEHNRCVYLGERPYESADYESFELSSWQYADLRVFEQHIRLIDEEIQKNT